MQAILSHVADGVLVVDKSGVVIFENDAASQLYRVSLLGANLSQEAPRWTTLNANREPFTEEDLPLTRVILRGETVEREDMAIVISPTVEFVIQVSAAPIRDENGQLQSAVLTLRDVTEQRQQTHQLHELNKSKDEFLAILSHELRTPLTPILGWASLLQQVGGDDHELFLQAVTAIERNAELMKRLVSDLLDTTRIVSGKLRTEKVLCDLNETARLAADSVVDMADDHGVRIHAQLSPELPTLLIDRERIQQVLMNLLLNAAKFSASGAVVHLRTSLENSTSSTRNVIVEVEDNGVGIAPELLPFVFDLFRQGNSSQSLSSQLKTSRFDGDLRH